MEKIAIITDSTCDITDKTASDYDLRIARLKIKYTNKEFTDGVDITSEEIYKNLETEIPQTSTPTMGEISEIFKDLKNNGYTHAIVLAISSGLSGTMNNFRLVSKDFKDSIKTEIFDTKSISSGVENMIIKVGKMINSGKTYDSIVSSLNEIHDSISIYFTVENLDNLIQGGRIGKIAGGIGNLLNLKPIISIGDDGKYYTLDKVRGINQSLSKMIKIATNHLDKEKGKINIMHGDNLSSSQKLYDALVDHPNLTEIVLGRLSPVAGVHAGPTILAFSFSAE